MKGFPLGGWKWRPRQPAGKSVPFSTVRHNIGQTDERTCLFFAPGTPAAGPPLAASHRSDYADGLKQMA